MACPRIVTDEKQPYIQLQLSYDFHYFSDEYRGKQISGSKCLHWMTAQDAKLLVDKLDSAIDYMRWSREKLHTGDIK